MPAEKKITFADMRDMGVRSLLIYCTDYRCSHSIANSDRWPDHVRLSDLEPRFVCQPAGRGADVRPDFNWNKQPVEMMGIVDAAPLRLILTG